MNWKEFFKPTIVKLIAPLLFLVWALYLDMFAPMFCGFDCPNAFERLVIAIKNPIHDLMTLLVMFILYYFSCSIVHIINKKQKNA